MNRLKESLPRLLLAFLLSFALWLFVAYDENPDSTTSFDETSVLVRNLPIGLVIVDQNGLPRADQTSLSQVSVLVRADSETLSELRQSDLRVVANLEGLTAGDHLVKVDVEPALADLQLNRFSSIVTEPRNVSVRLEQWITRTVPLTVEIEGNLPFSFERGTPDVTDRQHVVKQVTVGGPAPRVERVVGAFTVANIEQLRANYVSTLQLQPRDANNDVVEGIDIQPQQVRVRIPIRSVAGLKLVPVVATIEGLPAPGYMVANIRTEPPLVNITGSSGMLDVIDQVQTTPVDIGGATTTFTQPVSLMMPPGTSYGGDETIIVRVQIEPLLRSFQVQLPVGVEVTGLPPGYQISYEPRIITVQLAGTARALDSLSSYRLVATLNITGRLPGAYRETPQLVVPEGVRVVGDVPDVEVILRLPPSPVPTETATTEPTPIPDDAEPTPNPDDAEPTPIPDDAEPTPIPAPSATRIPPIYPTDEPLPTAPPRVDPSAIVVVTPADPTVP